MEKRMFVIKDFEIAPGVKKDIPVIFKGGKYFTFTRQYYKNDRASRVSGYDSNHLYGPFNAFTNDFMPAAHMVQLYRHERDMARMYRASGDEAAAKTWETKAATRKKVIIEKMWDPKEKMLFDCHVDPNTKKLTRRTNYPFTSSAYALWAGVFDVNKPKERVMIMNMVNYVKKNLEGPNGLYASGVKSGLHWDRPFCWPIQQGMVVSGLRSYATKLKNAGHNSDAIKLTRRADAIALKYLKANYRIWLRSRGKKIPEKVGPDKGIFTGYENQDNYTWNLAAVWDLHRSLSPEAKKNFRSYLVLMKRMTKPQPKPKTLPIAS